MRAPLLVALLLAGVIGVVTVLMVRPGRDPIESGSARPGAVPTEPEGDDAAGTSLREVVPAVEAQPSDPMAGQPSNEARPTGDPAPPLAAGDRALIPEHEPYESMTLADLEAFRDRLRDILSERELPEHQALLRMGLAEHVPGEEIHPTEEDTRTLTAYHSDPGVAGHFRTTLPRADYPQLHALKDEVLQIEELVWKRKAVERKR